MGDCFFYPLEKEIYCIYTQYRATARPGATALGGAKTAHIAQGFLPSVVGGGVKHPADSIPALCGRGDNRPHIR